MSQEANEIIEKLMATDGAGVDNENGEIAAQTAPDKTNGSSNEENENSLSRSPSQEDSSKEENNGSGMKAPNNNLNVKKSLLTSTGCGPDGSKPNENAKKHKIKLKKKVDLTAHISKFS